MVTQASFDSIVDILVQPGRLVQSPTDLSIGQNFPFGGTSLGLTENGIIFHRTENFKKIQVEEYGQEPVRIIFIGDEVYFSVELVEWTDAVKTLAWSGFTVAGGTSGEKNIEWPGNSTTMYPGKDIADNAIRLAFIPEDIINQTVVYFRKAVPTHVGEVSFKASEKSIIPMQFFALRDDSINSANVRYKSRGFFAGDRRDLTI